MERVTLTGKFLGRQSFRGFGIPGVLVATPGPTTTGTTARRWIKLNYNNGSNTTASSNVPGAVGDGVGHAVAVQAGVAPPLTPAALAVTTNKT